MACNGHYMVWASSRNISIFNVKTGVREYREKNAFSRPNICCYEADTSKWYS